MNTPPEETPFGDGNDGPNEQSLHPDIVLDAHEVLRDDINRENLPPIGDTPPRLAIDSMKPAASIDLQAAQAEYIVALHNYVHDPDLYALRKAQEAYINAQATYIHLADDRMLTELQEQIIGLQLRFLRKLGAV